MSSWRSGGLTLSGPLRTKLLVSSLHRIVLCTLFRTLQFPRPILPNLFATRVLLSGRWGSTKLSTMRTVCAYFLAQIGHACGAIVPER